MGGGGLGLGLRRPVRPHPLVRNVPSGSEGGTGVGGVPVGAAVLVVFPRSVREREIKKKYLVPKGQPWPPVPPHCFGRVLEEGRRVLVVGFG